MINSKIKYFVFLVISSILSYLLFNCWRLLTISTSLRNHCILSGCPLNWHSNIVSLPVFNGWFCRPLFKILICWSEYFGPVLKFGKSGGAWGINDWGDEVCGCSCKIYGWKGACCFGCWVENEAYDWGDDVCGCSCEIYGWKGACCFGCWVDNEVYDCGETWSCAVWEVYDCGEICCWVIVCVL
jgi:hypothetical protein